MSDRWYSGGIRAVDDTQKDEITARILTLWKAHPDLRFMQLLGNVLRGDHYYLEDYDMIQVLEGYYAYPRDMPPVQEDAEADPEEISGGS